jgi:hypothetical protein
MLFVRVHHATVLLAVAGPSINQSVGDQHLQGLLMEISNRNADIMREWMLDMEQRMSELEERMMERMYTLEEGMEERMYGMEERMYRLEEQMKYIEQGVDSLEMRTQGSKLQLSEMTLIHVSKFTRHVRVMTEAIDDSASWQSHQWLQGLQHVQNSEPFLWDTQRSERDHYEKYKDHIRQFMGDAVGEGVSVVDANNIRIQGRVKGVTEDISGKAGNLAIVSSLAPQDMFKNFVVLCFQLQNRVEHLSGALTTSLCEPHSDCTFGKTPTHLYALHVQFFRRT